jgi:vacuolar-type H+-ATPase subunit H
MPGAASNWQAAARGAKIAATSVFFPTEGANVPDGELKRIISRRGRTIVAVLVVGVAGVAWTGCGSSSSEDSSSKLEQSITEGVQEAEDAVEKGVNEAKESLKGTNAKTKKQLEKAEEEVKKGLEKGKEEAQKGIEKGKEEAQKGIEEAEKYAP